MFSCSEVRKVMYPDYASPPAEYWNPDNKDVYVERGFDPQMVDLRFSVLKETVRQLFQYLREGGQVGILDGSNLSHAFREYLMKQMESEV